MPWSYTFDQERDALLITGRGVLEEDELMQGVMRATRDPKFHPDIRIFMDYQAVAWLGFASRTMEKMAEVRVYSPNSRRAFLVSSAALEGFFQHYGKIVQAGKVQVFTDRAQALAWLNEGIPAEKWLT